MGVNGTVSNRNPVYYLIVLVLLGSLVPLQANIDKRRVAEKLVLRDQPAIRPGQAAVGLLLAGFRGVAANVLWYRSTVLFSEQKVTEMIPVLQAISYLQPRFRSTWSFGAWHMAYNVSADFYDRKDLGDEDVDRYRYRCFEIGEAFLRKGIENNYYHYDLHWDLGFTILYYKKYKLLKEKGWAGEKEALDAALKEMKIAYLFQPPLAEHPSYVPRLTAVIMREGGMLDEAYKIWYRLKTWPREDENMKLVDKNTKSIVENITLEITKDYALELETGGKVAEAYKVWCLLLDGAKKKKEELAKDPLASPQTVEETDRNVELFSTNAEKLAEALTEQGASPETIQKTALEEGTPLALRRKIDDHFQALQKQAEADKAADEAETMKMYRDLTKPAPRLDSWVFLYVPLLFLAMGYLMFGKEVHAS
jgi:hypothetical protein